MSRLLQRVHDHAIAKPESIAIINGSERVSYGELSRQIDTISLWLKSQNVHCLGLHCNNSVDWIVADLAAVQLNIPSVPMPGFFSPAQISHLIEDAGLDTILSDGEQSYISQKSVVEHVSNASLSLRRLHRDDPYRYPRCNKVTYTSGSTGKPKGVCLSQKTLESVVEALSSQLADVEMKRHLCILPFATLLENVAGVYLALWSGSTVVVGSPGEFGLLSNTQFAAARFQSAVNQYQINSAILLPQMLKAIVEYASIDVSSSLSFLAVGGGKTPPAMIRKAHEQGLPVYEGYGLSETASVLCINTPAHNRIGCVGKPLEHAAISIADDGEVLVRNPTMDGYLHDSEELEMIATGDIGYFDDDGYLTISGRKKNCLISGFGRNISPEWVESHFLGESAIQQFAVFGEAESHLSAVVVSQPDTNPCELNSLIDEQNKSLPDYAQIKNWVLAKEDFNSENGLLTANGKPRRDAILRQYEKSLFDGATQL